MQQRDFLTTLDAPPAALGPATTPEEVRRRGREGLCQDCGAAIDDEWLLRSLGWQCRACEGEATPCDS